MSLGYGVNATKWCFLEAFPLVFSSYSLIILYLFNVVICFEYSKLLNSYVVFRSDVSPLKSSFLATMEVLNTYTSFDALEDQNTYVWTTFETIENGWDSDFLVGCSLFELYAKCGSKKQRQNGYPFLLVQSYIFGWGNTTLLSLFSILILKVKCVI